MRVFDVYGRIIKKNLPALGIYFGIFCFFAVLLSMSGNDAITGFFETESRVMIINHDTSNPVTDGLVDYLTSKSKVIASVDTLEGKADSLFYEESQYILTIPEGFGESLILEEEPEILSKLTTDGSSADVKTNLLIEKYLNTFRLYVKSMEVLPTDTDLLEEIRANVQADLSEEVTVQFLGAERKAEIEKASSFFKYMPYSMISILILGITSVMQVFNKSDLKRRTMCAPVSQTRISVSLFVGNLCFAVMAWLALVISAACMTGFPLSDPRFLLMCLEALVFTMAALSLSFFCSIFIKTPAAQHSFANVIALGTSFISGVFVPLSMLGENVKRVASFTPTFWYVSGIEETARLTTYGWNDLKNIYLAMAIQLLFAALFLALALVLTRQRKRKEV
jgi:ABC-2 type transport system permease protein